MSPKARNSTDSSIEDEMKISDLFVYEDGQRINDWIVLAKRFVTLNESMSDWVKQAYLST